MSMNPAQPGDDPRRHVTTLLVKWSGGDDAAMQELVPLVYDELRRVARRQMSREREDHVLQATALVNEAFLRLVDVHEIQWRDRTHFFAMSARLMRRVLVDHARARALRKRGGGGPHVPFEENLPPPPLTPADLVALADALKPLAGVTEGKGGVAELRHFGGRRVEGPGDGPEVSV